jgi:hypothetical protein
MGLNSLAAGAMLPIRVDRPVEAALVRAAPVWLTDWTSDTTPCSVRLIAALIGVGVTT